MDPFTESTLLLPVYAASIYIHSSFVRGTSTAWALLLVVASLRAASIHSFIHLSSQLVDQSLIGKRKYVQECVRRVLYEF